MKKVLLTLSVFALLTTLPLPSTAQVAPPALGAATDYTVFTAAGAFNNVGPSVVQGNIGTAIGAYSGFGPGEGVLATGTSEVGTTNAVLAATAVRLAYTLASAISPAPRLFFGSPATQTLLPGAYVVQEATTLTGTLELDAAGNPNAVFFLRVGGAFATADGSAVTLTGGALARNVYWQVGGRLTLGQNSVMQGTLLVDGAVNLLSGAQLTGRVLTVAGAVSLDTNVINALPPAAPLPVALVGFTAARRHDEVSLRWSTASEQNSKSFRVERSSNSNSGWQLVSEVAAAGTSTAPRHYSTMDRQPAAGINYYRLQSIDLDGTYTYSQVRVVDFGGETSPAGAAFPNPVASQLTVTGAGPGSQLTLTDIAGRTHIAQLAGVLGVDLVQTNALPAGTYLLHLTSAQGQRSTLKVIRE